MVRLDLYATENMASWMRDNLLGASREMTITTLVSPTPAEIKAIRQRLGLTSQEFGEALGYSDPSRVVRALECGSRKGREYRLTGPGLQALQYLLAISDFAKAQKHGGDRFAATELFSTLPRKLRP